MLWTANRSALRALVCTLSLKAAFLPWVAAESTLQLQPQEEGGFNAAAHAMRAPHRVPGGSRLRLARRGNSDLSAEGHGQRRLFRRVIQTVYPGDKGYDLQSLPSSSSFSPYRSGGGDVHWQGVEVPHREDWVTRPRKIPLQGKMKSGLKYEPYQQFIPGGSESSYKGSKSGSHTGSSGQQTKISPPPGWVYGKDGRLTLPPISERNEHLWVGGPLEGMTREEYEKAWLEHLAKKKSFPKNKYPIVSRGPRLPPRQSGMQDLIFPKSEYGAPSEKSAKTKHTQHIQHSAYTGYSGRSQSVGIETAVDDHKLRKEPDLKDPNTSRQEHNEWDVERLIRENQLKMGGAGAQNSGFGGSQLSHSQSMRQSTRSQQLPGSGQSTRSMKSSKSTLSKSALEQHNDDTRSQARDPKGIESMPRSKETPALRFGNEKVSQPRQSIGGQPKTLHFGTFAQDDDTKSLSMQRFLNQR